MQLAIVLAIGLVIFGRKLFSKQKSKPTTKHVEVEISDPMLVEEIRNLYDMQEVYNAKIANFRKLNDEYQHEVDAINRKIQNNYENVRMQMRINPSSDVSILMAQCDASNEDYLKRRTRLEGMILANEEKIVQHMQKSNAITKKIDKIGHREYEKQNRK